MSATKTGTRFTEACLGVAGFFLCEVRGPEKIISHNTSSINSRARSVRPRLEALSGSGPTSRCLTKLTGLDSAPSCRPESSPFSIRYFNIRVLVNTVVAFDPKTKGFQSWPIPSGGGVVRNMVAMSDDRLYLACNGVNKVAIAEVKH